MLARKSNQATSSADRYKPWSVKDDFDSNDLNESNNSNFRSTQRPHSKEYPTSTKHSNSAHNINICRRAPGIVRVERLDSSFRNLTGEAKRQVMGKCMKYNYI